MYGVWPRFPPHLKRLQVEPSHLQGAIRDCGGALLPQTPVPLESPKEWRELDFKEAEQHVQHRQEQEHDQQPRGANSLAAIFSAVLSLVPLRLNHAPIVTQSLEKNAIRPFRQTLVCDLYFLLTPLPHAAYGT